MTTSSAQSTSFVMARNMGEINGKISVDIKWFTKDIKPGSSVFIYRQENQTGKWIRINDLPILPKKALSEQAKAQDEELEFLEYITQQKQISELPGMILASVWLKAFQNQNFAEYLGIYYKDSTVIDGNTYQYKIIQMTGGKPLDIGVSKMVKAKKIETFEAKVVDIKTTSLKNAVGFVWKEELERFWAVNIYRKNNQTGSFEKVNIKPIVPNISKDSSGKVLEREFYYIEDSLTESQVYEYRIAGIDFFGKETEMSNSFFVFLKDKNPPLPPKVKVDSIRFDHVYLSFSVPPVGDFNGYHIYRADEKETEYIRIKEKLISPKDSTYLDVVMDNKHYYYRVGAVDTSGNESLSERIIVFVADEVAPTSPLWNTIKADTGMIKLTWKASPEKDVQGYYIYRGSYPGNLKTMVKLTNLPYSSTSYIDTINKVNSGRFYYRIAAVDSSLNVSKWSDTLSAQMPDIIPPEAPKLKQVVQVGNELKVVWFANVEKDLKGYQCWIRKDTIWEKINNIISKDSTEFWMPVIKTGKIAVALTALDKTGNISPMSQSYIFYTRLNIEVKLIEIKKKKNKEHQVNFVIDQLPKSGLGYIVMGKEGDENQEWKPVSGLLHDKTYSEKIKSDGLYLYKIVWYDAEGNMLNSNELSFNIKSKKKNNDN
ncbi:MAG: hypothetical protein U0U66_14800 [Cytophagaceae bacterium]